MRTFCPEGALSSDSNTRHYKIAELSDAEKSGEILEGIATLCDSDYNLTVDLGDIKGIIPRCEGAVGISSGKTKDIALISRVGKPVSFVVNSLKTDIFGKTYAELSRRKAQERALYYITKIKGVGSVIDAKITHLESFGAFCDIGCGVVALLPIDAISVSRISHPKDRFLVGDNIKAIIKSIDKDGKITLSHKELLGTWEENASMFTPGQTVSGIIRSIEDYGVFVELTPNLAGLAEPRRDVALNQIASVYIKSIIPEKMKVKLIIVDSFNGDSFSPVKYFPTPDKIKFWQYSPIDSQKTIISQF